MWYSVRELIDDQHYKTIAIRWEYDVQIGAVQVGVLYVILRVGMVIEKGVWGRLKWRSEGVWDGGGE